MEVKRAKDEAEALEQKLTAQIESYEKMAALWNEFEPSLISIKDAQLSARKIAGVRVPMLDEVLFEIKPFSLFNSPKWYLDGIQLLQTLAKIGIEYEFCVMKINLLEYARKKTTQKVNLFEKVQIPGFEDAIRKIKRFMEDEENLSKSSQKIMKSKQENDG
jgi:V/A-type H+-transporting ATPase subunit D